MMLKLLDQVEKWIKQVKQVQVEEEGDFINTRLVNALLDEINRQRVALIEQGYIPKRIIMPGHYWAALQSFFNYGQSSGIVGKKSFLGMDVILSRLEGVEVVGDPAQYMAS